MKNSRLSFRIALDTVLVVLFSLLYKKNAVSLAFHEIVGLFVLALTLLHFVIGSRLVTNTLGKLADKNTSGRTKAIAIIDIVMLALLVFLLIDSILISKKLFPFSKTTFWIPMHFFTASLLLILFGIHLGMHLPMITRKWHMGKALCIILSVVMVIAGGYCLLSGNLFSWLKAPFSQMVAHQGNGGGMMKGQAPSFSFLLLIQSFLKAFSQMLLFAVVTEGIALLAKRKKRTSLQA